MEIVTATIAVAEIMMSVFPLVKQEIGYPFSYKSNLDKVKAEVQKLTDDCTDKQRIVEDAKRNKQDIAAAVEGWLNRVTETIADANGLINKDNEGHGELRCLKCQFPNLCVRRRLSKDSEKMARHISALINEGRSHHIPSFPVLPQMTTSPSARGYVALESRTSILNEIKRALKDPNIYMIGVYGMGGVGKTTLMKELAWQVKKEGSFDAVVMATITKTPNLRSIQRELAAWLGLKLETDVEEGRAGELRERISREKSILVILDDIWDELNLAELGIPYGDDHKGCKLVLTSRDSNVLSRKINTQNDFSLEEISEGESWTLFEKITGDVVKLQGIKPIAVDVVKCCAGLPLLIHILAKDLRNEQDVRVWNYTLTRLKYNSKDSGDDKVDRTLRLSYESLESEELKSLFLLIGSFGQVGIDIHTEELLQVCWGLGIYKDVCTLPHARNKQHTLIKDLRNSSLLLGGESETEWVKMHDLVLERAKLIASETRCIDARERFIEINEWQKNNPLRSYHIILGDCGINELPEKLNCRKLKVLLLRFTRKDYSEIPDNCLLDMGEEIKVLYLSGMKFTKPLPPSLSHLSKLRLLNLSGSELGDIAIVGKLVSLEILILGKAMNIEKLPEEIGNLTRLLVLNVSECRELRLIPKNLLSSLERLEELYMDECPIEWEVEGSNNHNNASLVELRNLDKLTALGLTIKDCSVLPRDLDNFDNLERYNISIGKMWTWKWPGSNISTTLILSGSSIVTAFSNVVVKQLLPRVEGLQLEEFDVGDDFMKLRRLVLHQLRSLTLEGLRLLTGGDAGLAPLALLEEKVAMPKLESMGLNGIHTCKIWDDNLAKHACIQNLRTLDIWYCGRLTSLFPSAVARALLKLKKLKINRCRKLKMIFAQEDISRGEVILPNLETLLIFELDELESLWPSHLAPNSYHELNKVEISKCPKLLNVLSSSCDSIGEIVASENDGDASSEIAFMNLEELELMHLPRLTSFCRENYSFKFPLLKTVHVVDCPVMETFCNGNLTAPSLTSVTSSEEDGRWDSDLNTTIQSIFGEECSRRSTSQISEQEPNLS